MKKIPCERMGNIDYRILDRFNENRILFTAGHAHTSKVKTPQYGIESYVSIGDKNTDTLAMLMGDRLQSSFLISRFSRIQADVCRPLDTLGKNEKILVKISCSKNKKKIYFPIHRDKDSASQWQEYHSLIEKLNPLVLVSVHGMCEKGHPPDILLGLGKNYRIIGGRENALKFKNLFIKKVNDTFSEFNIKNELKINISKWLFTGEKNYVLFKHVIQYNKGKEKKRFGMHVEFNKRGRTINGFVKKDYQIASQVLADAVLEWVNRKT